MRPYTKIIVAVSLVVILGLVIYFIWGSFAPSSPPGASLPTSNQNANLPFGTSTGGAPDNQGIGGQQSTSTQPEGQVSATGGLSKISENQVFDYWIDTQTQEIYYISPDGKIWSAKSGQDIKISDQKLGGLNYVEIGQTTQKILAAFGSPASPQWAVFDVIDGVWRPLPADVVNAAWGANQNEIIAVSKSSGSYALVRMDISKNPIVRKIVLNDFYLDDVRLTFLPPNQLLIKELGTMSWNSRVWQLDLKTLSFNSIISPARGLVFGTSLDKSLFFVYSGSGLNFFIIDNKLRSYPEVIFISLPSKCDRAANSSSTLVLCFSPQDVPGGNSFPDDYLKRGFFSVDNLYSFSAGSGDVNTVLISNKNGLPAIDAKNPQSSGGKLYFVNRYDDSLYSLAIGPS